MFLLEQLSDKDVHIDVILLCETFLSDNTKSIANLRGFQCFHRVRQDRSGGGVSLFISKNFTVTREFSTPFNENIESLFVECVLHSKKITIGEIYRIPNTNPASFVNDIQHLLNSLPTNDLFIFGTDQNIDFLAVKSYKSANDLLEVCLENSCVPYISRPTRVTHSSATLIDNIYLKSAKYVDVVSCILLEDLSDHYPCLMQLELGKKTDGYSYFSTRKLNDAKILELNHKLIHEDWECLREMDVNELYEHVIMKIIHYLDEIAPLKTEIVSKGRVFTEPWMTVKLSKYY